MEESQFECLVEALTPMILKEGINMSECIKPHELVCLALRYLASGDTFRTLEFQFRIGKKTVSRIVIDICRATFEILGPRYVNTPRNTRKWLEIAQKFYQRWDFPHK